MLETLCVQRRRSNAWRFDKRMLGSVYLETAVGTSCSSSSSTNPEPTQTPDTMQLTTSFLILLSAGAASAALNEPCYGPGGSAGAFPVLLPHPPRHQTLTQVRRLRAYVCLYLIRWHIHQRWLSAGRSRREVLQQAQMQQRTLRQLPLGQQLSRPQQHR